MSRKYRGQWLQVESGDEPKRVNRFKRIAAHPSHEQVISLVNEGLSYREVATRVGLSIRTVIRYVDQAHLDMEAYEAGE